MRTFLKGVLADISLGAFFFVVALAVLLAVINARQMIGG